MLGFGQVWSSNLPASHSPGAAPPVVTTWTPCPPRLGFQKVACPFCEPNTWYKISNYRHQILSPRRSETASPSLLRHFIFTGKAWPNVGHVLLCLSHAFYLFSTRQTHNKASFAGWPGNQFSTLYVRNAPAGPMGCTKCPKGISQVLAEQLWRSSTKALQFQRELRSLDFSSVSGSSLGLQTPSPQCV